MRWISGPASRARSASTATLTSPGRIQVTSEASFSIRASVRWWSATQTRRRPARRAQRATSKGNTPSPAIRPSASPLPPDMALTHEAALGRAQELQQLVDILGVRALLLHALAGIDETQLGLEENEEGVLDDVDALPLEAAPLQVDAEE